jgi:hypothetical protein
MVDKTRTPARFKEFSGAQFLHTLVAMKKLRYVIASLPLLALVFTVGAASATEGRAWGDIHVQTMDGATYDFQAAGEFVASRSPAGDLDVQLRLESTGFASNVSVATAVAVLVDTTRATLVLGREPLLYVDGEPAVPSGGEVELVDGGRIVETKRGYEIHWSDGTVLSVDARKRHLNAFLRPAAGRRGTLSGLFGNFNGIAADDVGASTSGGGSGLVEPLRPIADLVEDLLARKAEASLLAQEDSLFEYQPGQSTRTFRRPTPMREVTAATLPASFRRLAEAACEEAGVTAPDLLEACIIDVGYTRDESFADSAAAVQARDVFLRDSEAARQADAGL